MTAETPFPIPLNGWIMSRSLILEPKWHLSEWIRHGLVPDLAPDQSEGMFTTPFGAAVA